MEALMNEVMTEAQAQVRQCAQPARAGALTVEALIAGTKIKTPQNEGAAALPFELWPEQARVLAEMQAHPLLVILKARQLGISWLACAYVLWLCTQHPGKTVLLFSQGQLEANELIDRIRFMQGEYRGEQPLAALTTDNTVELEWANGSNVKSLPATRRAGRSFSASLVIFDEFAFMLFGAQLYGAAKPTIDDGGRLWIISSADGPGSAYHQFWQQAQARQNGFLPIFLPWTARPARGAGWRDQKIAESYGDAGSVLREYPANDIEAFTHAAGLVYAVWSDGPDDGNVRDEAEYVKDGGDVYWSVDDGYSGKLDPATGQYTALSHPRVIGFYQQRSDGTLCRFDESYAAETLSEDHIARALVMPHRLEDVLEPGDERPIVEQAWAARERLGDCYPEPDFAVVDSSAAELRGRLRDADITNYGGTHPVDEGIKNMRRWVAKDANGRRRLLVHPRCRHFRYEMAAYRYDDQERPVKQHDHGLDECRMLLWKCREDG